MKALAAILGILGSSAITMLAQMGPPLRCPSPPIREVVRELDGMRSSNPPSSDPTEFYANLRAAEIFQSNWLQDNKTQLLKVGIYRNGLEDVFLARWAGPANYPRIKNIEMWDGALYELVIVELDAGAIASEKSIRETLLKIIKPPPGKLRMSGPTAQELDDGFGFIRPKTSDTERWQGSILRIPTHQVIGYDEEFFTFHEIDGRVFLVFDLGKRAGYAPWPQSIYLGDRFPPLSELVKEWPKQRLLQQITAKQHEELCWDSSSVNVFDYEFRIKRDEVIVAELVRRGLDPEEFRAVMDSPNGRYVLVPALDHAHQTEQYRTLVVDALHRYETLPDVNQRIDPPTKAPIVWSHLADLIRVLPWRGGADFSDAIVELIASNHEPKVALDYLDWRFVSNRNRATPGVADKLAKTTVPAGLEQKRDSLVAHMRAQESAH